MDTATAVNVYGEITLPTFRMLHILILILIVLPLSVFVGHASGNANRKRTIASGKDIDLVTGQTSLGAILALLGLLVAFSFSNALNLTQTRIIVVTEEAAALSTAFLRADYLAEPGRTDLKIAIHDYAKTRVVPNDGRIDNAEDLLRFLERSFLAQAKLWPLTVKATADPLPPPIKTFVATAVNDALDSHLDRMQTLSVPVSHMARAMLVAAAIVSLLLLGNQSGLAGRKLTWRPFVFSGFLCVVLITIVDLQRSGEGLIRTNQMALLAVILEMELDLSR